MNIRWAARGLFFLLGVLFFLGCGKVVYSDAAMPDTLVGADGSSVIDLRTEDASNDQPILSYTIGGTLTGLSSGSVILQQGGGDDLSLSANGAFNFSTPINAGSTYSVTVKAQPTGQTCTVTSGYGKVAASNIKSVSVTCSVNAANTYTIGGTLTGLTAGSVVLQQNGGDYLTLSGNAAFTFSTPVSDKSTYSVGILSQPAGQTCVVSGGSGTVAGSNVTDVTVKCVENSVDTYSIGGTLASLTGGSVVLQQNGGDDLTLSANGAFTFATLINDGATYSVTVLTQPVGQTCTITDGGGTVGGSNITKVSVDCVPNSYTIGGTLAGLSSDNVVLQQDGADDIALSANGVFAFATPVDHGASYAVTILTQPTGQICTVTGGYGTVAGASITNVSVNCVPKTYTIGGTLTGLASGSVVLQQNGGDNITLSANGIFNFATPVDHGASYSVTILTQPSGQSCGITNGSGSVAGGNITNVSIICSADTYIIGGTLADLIDGSIVLQQNGGDNLTLSMNGAFSFSAPVNDEATYSVTVLTQPDGQICTVTGGTGTLAGSNVTSVAVTCIPKTYSIGGTLADLIDGNLVLQQTGSDNLTLSTNGVFNFITPIDHGATYTVTVLTQPTGQTCTVTNGSGAVAGANVINISVNCVPKTYTISGTLAGLIDGSVVLQQNGGDDLTLSANGAFNFATPIDHGAAYSVTVLTQPTGQTCTASSDSGTVAGGNIANVSVTCVPQTYTIGGTLAGLTSGSVVLQQNGGDDLTLSADGIFAFATPIDHGAAYSVTALTQPLGLNCTVTTGSGTVAASNVASVSVSCVTVSTYTVGGTLAGLSAGSVVLQQNGGDDLSLSSNGAFNFVTPMNDGSNYSVTVLTQPSGQNCSVGSASGTLAGSNVTSVSVNCVDSAGGFVYVANYNSDNVSTFSINSITGTLTEVGTEVAVGTEPWEVTVDPTGRFAYVANRDSSDVTTFSINPTTGALTEVGTEIVAGTNPYSVAVEPTGRFAYVANNVSSDVTTFSINQSTGALTEVGTEVAAGSGLMSMTVDPSGRFVYAAGSSGAYTFSTNPTTGELTAVGGVVSAGSYPFLVRVDPTGRFAYVANWSSNDVTTFSINPSTGALTEVGTEVAAGSGVYGVAVCPSGRFAYTPNVYSSDVTTFSINPSTGALTEVGTEVAAWAGPASITVSPTGRFAYTANDGTNNVATFSINASTGVLTKAGVDVAAGSSPGSVTVSPPKRFAYVANNISNNVTAFSINPSTGALTEVGTEVAAGAGSFSVTVDPTGRFAYVANYTSNDVTTFGINPSTGALSEVGTEVAAGTNPTLVTVDPTGRFAYVSNYTSNDLTTFSIDQATGALTEVGTEVAAGTDSRSISIDATGRFAYATNADSNDVTTFSINQTTGALTEVGTEVAAGTYPISSAHHLSGSYMYVANYMSNDVTTFSINSTTGALTEVGTEVAAGTKPCFITVGPRGLFAYVANGDSNDVTTFSINPSTGVLTEVGTEVAAGTQPFSITVEPTGRFAYVANRTSNDITTFSINPVTGALTEVGTEVAAGTEPFSITVLGASQ